MQDPYLTIWTKPRATFEYFFNERKSNAIFGLPFVIYGFSMGLTMGEDISALFDDNPTVSIRLLSYFIAIILSTGLAFLVLGQIQPWMIKVVGKIWGGAASTRQLANVNSLSAIPYCLILLYQLILFALGKDPSIYSVNLFFQNVLWVVTFRIFLIGLSIAQKFSYGIALLNFLISILPLVILRLAMSN